jgi:adenylate cyclase class 2
MNSEFEVRLLDINQDEWIKKLEGLGATFVGKYDQVRYIYDFNPPIENKWIRLRTDGKNTTLAIKDYQSTEVGGTKEVEIEVSDMEKTNEILNQLGYKNRSYQENRRVRYMLHDVEIDIDTWPHLNTYVEFEGKSKEAVFDLLKYLAIDESAVTTMDAQDIYLATGFTLEDMDDLRFS